MGNSFKIYDPIIHNDMPTTKADKKPSKKGITEKVASWVGGRKPEAGKPAPEAAPKPKRTMQTFDERKTPKKKPKKRGLTMKDRFGVMAELERTQ